MRMLIYSVFGLMLLSQSAVAAPDYGALVASLTDKVIVPAYHRMTERMNALAIHADAFCAAPSKTNFEKATAAFHNAMDAWQRVQPLSFGPVVENGRMARIEYWPDKRGTGARQLRAALQEKDAGLLAAEGLAGKSVALQSLSAFERLHFEHGPNLVAGTASDEDRYACRLAASIATFQSRLATRIMTEWMQSGGFRDSMLTAANGNAHFASAKEAATAILKGLVNAMDFIVRDKLEGPLGESRTDAKPRRAESWRSERSLQNVAASLTTVRDLYILENGFGDLLAAAGAKPLDLGMRKGFEGVVGMARDIPLPLHRAVADAEARPEVEALLAEVKSLRGLMAGSVATEIGLIVGFNAQDGD